MTPEYLSENTAMRHKLYAKHKHDPAVVKWAEMRDRNREAKKLIDEMLDALLVKLEKESDDL